MPARDQLFRSAIFCTREAAAKKFQEDYPEAYFIQQPADSCVTKCYENREVSFNPSHYIGSIREIVTYVGGD